MNWIVGTARDGSVRSTSEARRIVLAGEPRLYLEALSELLDSIPGVSASLFPPGNGHSLGEHAPELILLGCPASTDTPAELSGFLQESYPGVPLVFLDSGPTRDGSERAAPPDATARISTGIPLGELVKRLCDPANPIGSGKRRPASRARARREWPLSSLSDRELSVLRLVVGGRTNDEAAEALGISRHTVRTHLQNIMAKMQARSRTELVSVAMRSGMRTGAAPVTRDR
ncbi:MAG TPA: response regulator transcription factor [Acidimicrobiales bacterium]